MVYIKNIMDKSPSAKTNPFLIFLLIISIGFVGSLYLINRGPQQSNDQLNNTQPLLTPTIIPSPTITPTPKPKPIPHGKKNFFTTINGDGPKMGQGTIDPYDPALNSTQQLTIEVADSKVSKVEAFLQTDHNKTGPFQLKLISGSDKSGNWNGEWTVDDSYFYKYLLTIVATGAKGESSVTINFR